MLKHFYFYKRLLKLARNGTKVHNIFIFRNHLYRKQRWIEFFIGKNAIFYRSPFMRILPKHYNKLALKRNSTMTENSKYYTFEEPATRLIENQHTTPTTPHHTQIWTGYISKPRFRTHWKRGHTHTCICVHVFLKNM